MEFSTENILFIGAVLLLLSIILSKTGFRFGIPSLLIFLSLGMLAGSDGIGNINFDDPALAQFLGVIALNFILFSGGLDTRFKSIKPVLKPGLLLSTVGVLITTGVIAIGSHLLLPISLTEGFLLGAIVSSTDAAAVFSILRSKKINLKHNLRGLLEMESGSNDPMAYFLTITFTSIVLGEDLSFTHFAWMFAKQVVIGVMAGVVLGKLATKMVNKINLIAEGLYPVLLLSIVFFTYSLSNLIGGNGFLSVYIIGIIMGNAQFIHKNSLVRFYDGIAWLFQIVMFLALGLLVFPSQLPAIAWMGCLVAGVVIVLARPLAVFLCMLPFGFNFRSMLFVSWVGLRGAVPIVFATFPLLAGVEQAGILFNLVFFVTITSVALQGTSLSFMAKLLGLIDHTQEYRSHIFEVENFNTELVEIEVPKTSPFADKTLVEIKLPPEILVVLIKRKDTFVTPTGGTKVLAGDVIVIMGSEKQQINEVKILASGTSF